MKVKYKRLNTSRAFGIELEVGNEVPVAKISQAVDAVTERRVITTGWDRSVNNSHWHVKSDISCGPLGPPQDHGWEIASFKASGLRDLAHIIKVADALQKEGLKINNNCAFHVHVNIEDFPLEKAAILLAYWLKIEGGFCQTIPEHRLSSVHCKPISSVKKYDPNKFYSPQRLWELVRPTNLDVHNNQERRVMLNMVNYAAGLGMGSIFTLKRQTAEFRFPEGTLDGEDVFCWVVIFLNFIEQVKRADMPSTLKPVNLPSFLSILGLESAGEFLLLDNNLRRAKLWLLDRIKTYGNGKFYRAATKKIKVFHE